MKGLNRKVLLVMVLTLVLIEISTLFLMYKSLSNHKPELEKVSLKNEIKKDMFAILIEQEDGTYETSDDNVWPTSKALVFDVEKSGCIDMNGEKLNGVLSYENGVATVETGNTSYCYLYFSIDKVAPESFAFYLGGDQNPPYTTSTTIGTYLEWQDTDIASYCVTNTEGSDSCTWVDTIETFAESTHTLTTGDGVKTAYAYLKDYAGNISVAVADTITLDTVAPVIDSVTKTSKETTSITIEVTGTDATSGTQLYYYKIGDGIFTYGASATHTFTGLTAGTTYSITVYIVDSAGNIGEQYTVSLKTEEDSFGGYLINNPTTGLNSTIEGGMYRYQGTINDVANYVCFGTTDKDTCTSNPGKYMYMIIGVVGEADSDMETEVNMVKVIKKEALDTKYAWAPAGNYWWNPSASSVSPLFNGLNGSYYLTNTGTYSYFSDSSWLDKIANIKWKYNDVLPNDLNMSAADMYLQEMAFSIPTAAKKISLMYLHDYYYAYQNGGLNCVDGGSYYTTCVNSWIHITKRDSGAPSQAEWTMVRGGSSSGYTYNFVIRIAGGVAGGYYSTNQYSVSPVFYLTTDVKYGSGTGTSTDPFIIS